MGIANRKRYLSVFFACSEWDLQKHMAVCLLRVITYYDNTLSKDSPVMDRKSLLPKHVLLSIAESKSLNGLVMGEIQVCVCLLLLFV